MLHHADDGGIVDIVGVSAHTEFVLVESDDGSDEIASNNENNNTSAALVLEEASSEKVASPARTVDLSPTPTLTIIHPESDDIVGDGPQRTRRASLTDRTFQRVKSAVGRRKTRPASPARLPPKIGVRKTFIAGSRTRRWPGILRRNTRSSAETADVISTKRRNSEGDFAQVDELQSAFCSGARSLKGRKYVDKSNEDTFIAIGDLFATVAAEAPPSPPPSPRPQDIGKIGVFGVFDGHGGASCSAFVARNLPAAIANSGAWARLTMGSTSSSTGAKMMSRNNAFAMSACNSPSRPSAAADKDFQCLVKDVMQEAIVDAFQSTQTRFEAFARSHRDDSGSTAVVAMVWQGWVVIANLGDSGALFHNDNMFVELGRSYTARTECHTVDNVKEKERVEMAGGSFSKGRLLGKLQPTRSFGDMDVHRIKEGVLSAVPEVTTHRVLPTTGVSCLVLGSDGLWGGASESKLMGILRAENRRHAKKKTEVKLSKMAASLAQESARRGNGDDVTAVVVLFN